MRWWTQYGGEVEKIFTGESWTSAVRLNESMNVVETVDDPGLCLKPGRVHSGLNSGYKAIGLAFMWGAERIILLGYDMQYGPNGETHHYGDHDGGLPNLGTLPEWADRFVQLGIDLRRQRVEVINATRRTAITCFDQLPLEKALRISRERMPVDELTVLCVLKSGGDYDAEYVRKLRDGVARNVTIPHKFVCLSDVPVPCERIPLLHGWKGWWSKLEMFRPGVITGPTLYLDLDTVITGNLDRVALIHFDFAMLDILEKDPRHIGNSGAMWIAKPFPHVYERFAENPEHWIDFHEKNARNRYMGDQAFISDCFQEIDKLHMALPGFFKSYKYDSCQEAVPKGCSVVCFGGQPRPKTAGGWVQKVWT